MTTSIGAVEQVVSLIIPFIALAFLSVMIDKLVLVLENISEKIPHFPDEFPWWLNYFIVLSIAYYIVWQGNYDFWAYLNVNFNYMWQGYLMTALILSGGSALIKVSFSLVDIIPVSISGVTTTIRRMVIKKSNGQNGEEHYPYPEYDQSRYTEDI